jgi:hypothetical protein
MQSVCSHLIRQCYSIQPGSALFALLLQRIPGTRTYEFAPNYLRSPR